MNERYQTLAAINGVAIKCLIAMVWEQHQLTVKEIEVRVGHDKNTVRKALAQLSLYGLAAQVVSSQETWYLTDKGFQLPLPLRSLGTEEQAPGGSPAAPSGENFSPLYVSRLVVNDPDPDIKPTNIQTNTSGENFTTGQPARKLLSVFESKLGSAPNALASIQSALEKGIDLDEIEHLICDWTAYFSSDAGKGAHSPALIACKKIAQGLGPPEWWMNKNASTTRDDRRKYVEGRYTDYIYS